MKIKLTPISIRDLVKGFKDENEEGVVAYNGLLNVRPKYQREFIYKPKQQEAVIWSIINDFPLNSIYWAKNDDGTFEVIDGQQRILSICKYIHGDFAINYRFYHNLEASEKQKLLNYKLQVYICEGNDKEKLEWFKIINIAGVPLTNQELRNAVYSGTWVTDAKRYFSKSGCPAYQIGSNYVNGRPLRQEYLEKVLKWISKGNIEDYMSKHQHDPDAKPLWEYYEKVIAWIKQTFPTVRKKIMKKVDWGFLYNNYKDADLNPEQLETRIQELILDDDVTDKSGIYPYLLTGDEKYLNIRTFPESIKQKVYQKQNGKCAICKETFDIDEMEADHITPWCEGGKTVEENCQLLCKKCNRHKSNL